jgi:hypothetical protein
MTLLIKMRNLLPIGAQINLSMANGSGVFEPSGTFEVVDVNSAEGNEDTHVYVAYRRFGETGCGSLLLFSFFSTRYTVNDPQQRIDAVRRPKTQKLAPYWLAAPR